MLINACTCLFMCLFGLLFNVFLVCAWLLARLFVCLVVRSLVWFSTCFFGWVCACLFQVLCCRVLAHVRTCVHLHVCL